MGGETFSLTRSELLSEARDPRSQDWVSDNVLHPFANGTGLRQIYNNFASEKLEPAYVAPAKTLSTDWLVQNLSSAAGAVLTYSIVGKATGMGLTKLGESLGVQGGAARFLASETAAQILGAGIYDLAKSPYQGETRLGNAAASVAAFGVYSAGNHMLAANKAIATSTLYSGLGRVAVGALGGLSSLETAHFVSGLAGVESKLSFEDRLNAIASGGFINLALPPLQKGLTKVIDHAVNNQSWGKGIPIERYLEYKKEDLQSRVDSLKTQTNTGEKQAALAAELAQLESPLMRKLGRENALARVKVIEPAEASQSKAEPGKNRVWFKESDGPSKLAHELAHLRLAKMAEPRFQEIAKYAKNNPLKAEADYYLLRANMESVARQAESTVKASNTDAPAPQTGLIEILAQKAGNGKTYFDNWQSEWQAFKNDSKSRPLFEHAKAETPAVAAPKLKQAANNLAFLEMGATVGDKGINFAVKSESASKIEVLVYDKAGDKTPSRVIPMQKSGNTWHVFVEGLPEGTLYQYRADGPNTPEKDGTRFNNKIGIIDPEAKAVSKSEIPVSNRGGNAPEHLGDMPKSIALKDSYDWQGVKAPNTPMADTIIYELSVRGYTGGDQSLGKLKGTYRGLIEKIPHLKELGITAVELMPIFQGDRAPWPPKNPQTGEQLYDSWNYNPVAFKAPDGSMAADGHLGKQVAEFKDLVKAMHANKIEVILDVVFNHTREMDAGGPSTNLRVLDNKSYYHLDKNNPAQYVDKTGVGNTLNANSPLTQDLIINSLRYWVQEMHVDGFRFDLASTFKYDANTNEVTKSEIMKRIENDPVLSKTKLIAEPWSIAQYHLGRFSDRLWSEWNGDYRDTVRKFVKSDTGQTGTLAERIAGSPQWFDARQGRHSINAVTFHDGFTLNDLVSYNQKHNLANGENNRDGSNDNHSWNGGVEGPLDKVNIPEAQKQEIAALRSRQAKNLMALLMLSRGTPLILGGDEFLHTTGGNNNTWNQDRLNAIDWSLKEKNAEMNRFTQMIIDLRKTHGLGRLEPSSFIWHGVEPHKPDFADYTRLIAWQTKPGEAGAKSIYSAFNSYWEPITVKLPQGSNWHRLVDTNLPAGQDIVLPKDALPIEKTYTIQPRSGIVLEGR